MVRGKGSGAGRSAPATRVVSQDGLRIRLDNDNNDFNIDDNLDFEPEDENSDQSVNNISGNTMNYLSDQSTVLFQNSDKDVERSEIMAESDTQSILSAYRGEMISFSRTYSKDNREKDYLKIVPSVASSRTILDSSSSSGTSISLSSDEERAFSKSPNESDSLESGDEMENDEEVDNSMKNSADEDDAEAENNVTDIQANPVFRDKKVVVTNKNITITSLSRAAPTKRKWNRAFQSDPSSISLALEDVGYSSNLETFSDAGSDTASSMSSTNSGHLRTTLKVTFNSSSERICQQVESTRAHESPDTRRSPGADRSPGKSKTTTSPRSDDPIFRKQTPPRSPISDNQFRSPISDDEHFKMPLPPVKRPPSRPRRSDISSLPSSNQSNSSSTTDEGSTRINQKTVQTRGKGSVMNRITMASKDDDTISLLASTLGGGDHLENIENLNIDLQDPDEIKDENYSQTELSEQDILGGDLNREYIENWINNIQPTDRAPSSIDSLQPRIPPLLGDRLSLLGERAPLLVERPSLLGERPPLLGERPPLLGEKPPLLEERPTIQLMPTIGRDGSFRVDFRKLPRFFSGLCFRHYFGNGCHKSMNCSLFHHVPTEKYTARCRETASQELLDCYRITLRFHKLLGEIYSCFLEGFAFHKMESALIGTISDYLSPSLIASINAVEALGNIIAALEKTGLTFQETIEKISFNVGFMNYPILANILLDIISDKINLSEYWEDIKRISRVCGQIPPNIAERILSRVTSVCPLDKNLCTDIYNFIVRDNRTDLSNVRRTLLQPFETLINFGNGGQRNPPMDSLSDHIRTHLTREREIFERTAAPPPVLNDRLSAVSEEKYMVANNGGSNYSDAVRNRRLSRASSSASSTRSSLVMNPISFEHVGHQEINRYVPELAARKLVQQPVSTSAEYSSEMFTLFPNKPIFGSPRFRPDFVFNESIHNLLPESNETTNMHERDIVTLNEAIKKKDGNTFVRMLDSYKDAVTVEYFITMTIAHLNNLDDSYKVLMDLLENIELARQDYLQENIKTIKGIFEVIVFNLLFSMEKKCQWKNARKLLEDFCDWDSLISSKRYSSNISITPMGRYIFLSKILIKSNGFGYAFEILQCPTLHLLEAPENWPLPSLPIDLKCRNNVLRDFFTLGYRHDVIVVSALYEKIFKTGELYGYDAHGDFNPMLINLIDEEKISSLKRFAAELFYREMDKQILRAFTILMMGHIGIREMFRIYEFGCQKNIYVRYTGMEPRICIRTIMSDAEITIILKYYFQKLLELETHPSLIIIEIKLPEGPVPSFPAILQRSIRSIMDINISVKMILRDSFDITANTTHANDTEVIVNANEISEWLSQNLY